MSGVRLQQRHKAVGLYRQLLKTARSWPVQEEREYIVKETQSLFHKNKDLTDPEKIDAKLFEAESRLELGLHYKIPFPRLFHGAPDSTGGKLTYVGSGYMHTYEEETTEKGSASAGPGGRKRQVQTLNPADDAFD